MTKFEWGDKLYESKEEFICPRCGNKESFYIAEYGRNWQSSPRKTGWGYGVWCNKCIKDDIWIWDDEIEFMTVVNEQ